MIHIVILIQLGPPTCSSLIEALYRPGHQHIIGTSGGHLQEELVTGSDALYSYRNWRVTSLGTGGTGESPVWEQEELDYPIVVRTGGRSSVETLPTVPIWTLENEPTFSSPSHADDPASNSYKLPTSHSQSIVVWLLSLILDHVKHRTPPTVWQYCQTGGREAQ